MESRFPDGPVGAGSTQGSLPGEPLVAIPLSLSLSLPMSIGSLANLVLAAALPMTAHNNLGESKI